jgi:hypothetical protein
VTSQNGELIVHLFGKTSELVRAESRERQMGYDEFVRQVIEAWAIDMHRQRRYRQHEPLERRIGEPE